MSFGNMVNYTLTVCESRLMVYCTLTVYVCG